MPLYDRYTSELVVTCKGKNTYFYPFPFIIIFLLFSTLPSVLALNSCCSSISLSLTFWSNCFAHICCLFIFVFTYFFSLALFWYIIFKGEAITFKATTTGILATISHCLEQLMAREEQMKRRLEREQAARRQAEDRCRQLQVIICNVFLTRLKKGLY